MMETLTFIRLDYVMKKTGLEKSQIDHFIERTVGKPLAS
ncbi:AlpA family phage regulatory protein [Photorhabdus heterorhabditis]|nr:AlpA family phage regulatory protein [Photorhabdus heterorhabditis]NRN28432.1 AlpA family phage regulatory protein [Photorhabdus heterorhabditis subsp. aluminescens]